MERTKISERLKDVLLIAAAFAVWIVIFRDFISGKLDLTEDAISYYEHIRFYVENIMRGVFPLWDPWWFCGSANSFFLQRMGCFNPFLFFVMIFKCIGFSFQNAYVLYSMVYYFAGCVGFYLLARRVIQDRVGAFTAFFLLLYSALGTRIFDSFIILMFTPTVWFFYFLVSFSSRPQRHSFMGMILTVMIVLTTYIPFYFIVSVLSFLAVYMLLYWRSLPDIALRYLSFLNKNKLLSILCIVLLAVSLVPGFLFFKAGSKGEYLMPRRNAQQAVDSVLEVKNQGGFNGWALVEEFLFSSYYYTDLTQIPFAVLYIPLFSCLVFGFGFLTRISRKALLIFVWIVFLVLICIPNHAPVYGFLYKHIFFFKYFRNLHFFLWVAILPAFCLFLGEQFKSYLAWRYESPWKKVAGLIYATFVHGFAVWVLNSLQCWFYTAYIVLGLSYLFFVLRIVGSIAGKEKAVLVIILALSVIDPLEIYGYLSSSSPVTTPFRYSYDSTGTAFHHLRNDMNVDDDGSRILKRELEEDPGGKRVVREQGYFYYVSKWFAYLSANVDMYVLKKYSRHRFVVYDAVKPMDESQNGFLELETVLAENRNVAFVSTNDQEVSKTRKKEEIPYYARPIKEDAPDFRVEAFNANTIRVKTNFSKPKFVVYTDNYHEQWRVYLSGKQVPLIRSNVAFKGLWVPAGDQTIEFRFGSAMMWMVYLFLMTVVYILFIAIVMSAWKECKRNGCGRTEVLVS